MRATQHCGLLA